MNKKLNKKRQQKYNKLLKIIKIKKKIKKMKMYYKLILKGEITKFKGVLRF